MGTTTVTNHQSNSSKLNGNTTSPSTEKLTTRRIPRLVRSGANIDDHNNNLVAEVTSYKNGCVTGDMNGKVDVKNGEVNGNASRLVRIKKPSILKSPNFRARVTSGDE